MTTPAPDLPPLDKSGERILMLLTALVGAFMWGGLGGLGAFIGGVLLTATTDVPQSIIVPVIFTVAGALAVAGAFVAVRRRRRMIETSSPVVPK